MHITDPLIVPSSDDAEPLHEIAYSPKPKMSKTSILAGAILPVAQHLDKEPISFSSSPVIYPPSSSPPRDAAHKAKRKLFQSFSARESVTKKPKIIGGFEADEDEDDEEVNERIPSGKEGVKELVYEQARSVENIPDITSVFHSMSKSPAEPELPPAPPLLTTSRLTRKTVQLQTYTGAKINIPTRTRNAHQSYEEIIAQRSTTAAGRAKTAYYGIDIHSLIDEAKIQRELNDAAAEVRKLQQDEALPSVEEQRQPQTLPHRKSSNTHQMWTEKYRAKKFTELVGDERTHRSVLRWLKAWDDIVFPGMAKLKPKKRYEDFDPDKQHRKVLLLTGPPGLGKTTLAHVCAKQAGYEVLEINASDDRSRDVVKGRIKDALGTETVRGIQEKGRERRAGRPVCVIVDEVDGVVGGNGGSGGEGGFMKALIDLVHLDQKNLAGPKKTGTKGKGDKFRLMRPLIMICNDVYVPALRPLRQSGLAEVIHVKKPALDKVVFRLKNVFEKENIACDNEAVRRLCESAWGLGTRKQNSAGGRGAGDGDIRGILVQGEWAAHKLRASSEDRPRLTRKWIETHLGEANTSQKGFGRGGIREVVERIFLEGAGMPNLPVRLSKDEERQISESKSSTLGVADLRKRAAISALQEMINTCGEHDRLMTECFSAYPTQVFQDDTLLSKPNASYEWLHFHDSVSSRVYSGQEWELGAYLATSACGFHDLFADVDRGVKSWNEEKITAGDETDANAHPFLGVKADFAAHEAGKANRAVITEMQSNFSAPLLRLFSSVDVIATELIPNVGKMLAPEVKPVMVGGSAGGAPMASVRKDTEKNCIKNAVRVMYGLGVNFEKVRVEHEGGGAHSNGGYVLRMEPPLDVLTMYHFDHSTSTTSNSNTTPSISAPVRYAIRQVLAQELYKEKTLQASLARQARVTASSTSTSNANDPGYSGRASEIDNTNTNDDEGESDKENHHPNIPISSTSTSTSKNIKPNSRPNTQRMTVSSVPTTTTIKKDFFGRPIATPTPVLSLNQTTTSSKESTNSNRQHQNAEKGGKRTWVSFHEGYSNAVRKYISLNEFMDGF